MPRNMRIGRTMIRSTAALGRYGRVSQVWGRRRLRLNKASDLPDFEEIGGDECVNNLFHLENEQTVISAKNEVLSLIAGLDRGLVATREDSTRVDDLCKDLEREGISVDFFSSRAVSDLKGKWRLLYSSGFNTGSLGGQRPGPPAAISPLSLGTVYQDISDDWVDNIVDLSSFLLRGQDAFVEALSQIPGAKWQTSDSKQNQPPTLRACLRHSYTLDQPDKVTITFESTTVKPLGAIGGVFNLDFLPEARLPQLPDFLQPPKDARSAAFRVTYLDPEFRVSRGDRGELRIYTKQT